MDRGRVLALEGLILLPTHTLMTATGGVTLPDQTPLMGSLDNCDRSYVVHHSARQISAQSLLAPIHVHYSKFCMKNKTVDENFPIHCLRSCDGTKPKECNEP